MSRPRASNPTWCAMGCLSATVIALLLALTLTACAPSPLSERWIEARPLAAQAATWRPPRAEPDEPLEDTTPLVQESTGDLTLRGAVALALLYSPDLAVYSWGVRVAEARSVQAGLSPNPRVGYGAENFGGPDADDLFLRQTVRLSQVIELASKREKRFSVAEADQRLAAWDYEARRLAVVTLAAQRHVAVVAAQERVALAERALRLTQQVYDIIEERVDAGVAAAAARDKAVVRVSLERIAANRARHQLQAAREALASIWGAAAPTFDRAVGDMSEPITVPDLERLSAQARDHPRLARWADELERRRRAVALAQAKGVPDVTVGGGLRHFPDADDVAGVVEASIALPIIDRNQGRVLEARYRLGQARARQRAAKADLRRELAQAHADLAAAHYALRMLQTDSIPAARSAFEAAREAFATGRTDYLDVLDAERTLIDVERRLINAREATQSAAAQLEGLTATPLVAR